MAIFSPKLSADLLISSRVFEYFLSLSLWKVIKRESRYSIISEQIFVLIAWIKKNKHTKYLIFCYFNISPIFKSRLLIIEVKCYYEPELIRNWIKSDRRYIMYIRKGKINEVVGPFKITAVPPYYSLHLVPHPETTLYTSHKCISFRSFCNEEER